MATRAKVNPRTSTPTHTISLSDGTQNWGLRLEGDYKYIQETPQTPSTLMINAQGGKFGDFDPSMSHIQQEDFSGGRGSERLSEDDTRFADSSNMWTLSSGYICPTLQWHYVIGDYVNSDNLQPATNYNWKSLAGISYAVQFTATDSYTAKIVSVWVRRIGNPDNLTISLYENYSGTPSTLKTSVTYSPYDIDQDNVKFIEVLVDTSISVGEKYHLVVTGSQSDDLNNHWEVMTVRYAGSPISNISFDLSAWAITEYKIYFRVSESAADTKYKYFVFNDQLYAVQLYPTGTTTSKLFKLYFVPSGFDSASGQDLYAEEVTSTGLASVSDVLSINGIAYFAQGNSSNMRRWNGTTWEEELNKASQLIEYSHPVSGIGIYRVHGTKKEKVAFSEVKAWSTNLAFDTDYKVSSGSSITKIVGYQDKVYILKTDSIWTTDGKDKTIRLNCHIDDANTSNNGRAAVEHGQYLYFSLDKSMVQLYGTNLTDVGPAHGTGIPSDRSGFISSMESVFDKLFYSICSKSGYSSIMMFDGVNHHEIWRAPQPNKTISNIFWYSGKNIDYPYLLWDYGGNMCYMKFPDYGFNPAKDRNIFYSPAGHIISSTIDMNQISLPKMFKELNIVSKNLYNYRTDFEIDNSITHDSKIEVDVQIDNDIDSENWYKLGTITQSPSESVEINKSNVNAIRYRIRLFTSDASMPPIVKGVIVKGFARTPIKYQWVLRIKTSSMQSTLNGAPDHNPNKLLKWLKEKAGSASMLTMHSVIADLDQKNVLLEPPSVQREFVDPTQKSWGGVITVVIREA